MPKRRDLIHMTEDETLDFLATEKTLQVATLDRHGAPHLTTLWYAVVDGHIAFHTFTKSQKIVNLERDPRISVLVESGDSYDQLRGVSIQGTAKLIEDDSKYRYVGEVIRRYRDIPEDQIESAARQVAAKRTVVLVEPDKVITWDHRKLAGGY